MRKDCNPGKDVVKKGDGLVFSVKESWLGHLFACWDVSLRVSQSSKLRHAETFLQDQISRARVKLFDCRLWCLDMAMLPAAEPYLYAPPRIYAAIIQLQPAYSDAWNRLLNYNGSLIRRLYRPYSYSGNPDGLLGISGTDSKEIDNESAETPSSWRGITDPRKCPEDIPLAVWSHLPASDEISRGIIAPVLLLRGPRK